MKKIELRISDGQPKVLGDVQDTTRTYKTLVNLGKPGYAEAAHAVFGLASAGRGYFMRGDRGVDLVKVFPTVNGPDGRPLK